MQSKPVDFYLSSREHQDDWTKPRSCTVKGTITGPDQECLWVKVHPPVIGQPYGLGGENIEDLLVTPHLVGERIRLPLKKEIPVHIYRILDRDILHRGKFAYAEVELAAWGELYPTWESASQTD